MTSLGARDLDEEPDIELQELLAAVARRRGYDFRHHAAGMVRTRLLDAVRDEGAGSLAGLRERVLRDPSAFQRLVVRLSLHDATMFRDPSFFRVLRRDVLPLLRTYPFVRVWVAGCATGEEVYSLAILLAEADLEHRCRIYGTDICEDLLDRARRGSFSLAKAPKFAANYRRSGGVRDLSDYYRSEHGFAVLHESLRANLVFATHNLLTDTSFNEFHLILCRNVMVHFVSGLRNQVHRLLYASLVRLGVLGLGPGDTLEHGPFADRYAPIDEPSRVYRRVR